jgi:glucose-1-phosphate adenylyltransferase
MSQTGRQSLNISKVLCVIMGGGQGTRLFPLTKDRAKPAVPLAGKYRIVDIPISNCINSSFRRIYILTQFNSTSLHSHISRTYKFDQFSSGFVEILAAQQTFNNTSWYEGTADAVRKNLIHFMNHDFDYLLILSGDQLYRMDFKEVIEQHRETGAEITIATLPVGRNEAKACGILQMGEDHRITRFVEKPKEDALLASLRITPAMAAQAGIKDDHESYLASMGIYVFNRSIIRDLLDNPLSDFGKHIIPHAINTHRVYAYVYQGYWEDIGTIRSFFEANLDLARLQDQRRGDRARLDFGRLHHQPRPYHSHHCRPAHVHWRGHLVEPHRHPRQRLLRVPRIRAAPRGQRPAARGNWRALQNRERHH